MRLDYEITVDSVGSVLRRFGMLSCQKRRAPLVGIVALIAFNVGLSATAVSAAAEPIDTLTAAAELSDNVDPLDPALVGDVNSSANDDRAVDDGAVGDAAVDEPSGDRGVAGDSAGDAGMTDSEEAATKSGEVATGDDIDALGQEVTADLEAESSADPQSPAPAASMAHFTIMANGDDDDPGDPAPPTYPMNLPPGYVRVPTSVTTIQDWRGNPFICVTFSMSWAFDIYQYPETDRRGPGAFGGTVYFSYPGHDNYATRTGVGNVVGGSDLQLPGHENSTWTNLGSSMGICGDNGGWYSMPKGPNFNWDAIADDTPGTSYSQAVAAQMVVWGNAANMAPRAGFTWKLTDPATREITFTNTSSDDDAVGHLRYEWSFGDDTSSNAPDPVHTYDSPGRYTVTLVATDSFGASATFTDVVDTEPSLVVNSVGDAPAVDAAIGCDTGETVGSDEAQECTLRAAIEAANAAGGGEITFNIDGAPVISVASALPAISTPINIDGTTQPEGWVEVSGDGNETVFTVTGGTAQLTGLALHGAETAIYLSGGSGHVVEGNRIGVNLSGAATDDTRNGIVVDEDSSDAVVRGNILAADSGILVLGTAVAELNNNLIGVTESGAKLGSPSYGIQIFNAPSTITGNTVRASTIAVALVGADAAGSEITKNLIGTTGESDFEDAGTGVVIEGAPSVTIAENIVNAGNWGGIVVAGAEYLSPDGDGGWVYDEPSNALYDEPATSKGVNISGNTVRAAAGAWGIGSWAGAHAITVEENNIVSAGQSGVYLDGGSEHTISNNEIGTAEPPAPYEGIWLRHTENPSVSGNTIFAAGAGIFVEGDGGGARIAENRVSMMSDEGVMSFGIDVEDDRTGVRITGNTVSGAGRAGIQAEAPGSQITGNTVTESGNGILAEGDGLLIRDNRLVDLSSANTSFGNGIVIDAGSVEIRANQVSNANGNGIYIGGGATAKMVANQLWDIGGRAIAGSISAPNLEAAIIGDSGSTQRTTLLVTGLPGESGGTLEVFANASCEAGDLGEARYATNITRTTKAGRTEQIIQLTGGHNHFTLTYTTKDGVTSVLSTCQSRATHADDDGDGSVDPLDALIDAVDDPTAGVLITRNEQLLILSLSEGAAPGARLARVSVGDDPAPGAHPVGWSLPYGTISFSVTGLEQGGSAQVQLAPFFADEPLLGNAYWKYAPASPGAAPSWFNFGYESASRTGAQIMAFDSGGSRLAHVLSLVDGARGDADGAADGVITDPGGPVITDSGGSGITDPGGPAVTDDSTPPAANPGTSTSRGALSTTGSEPGSPVWAALALLLLGAGLMLRKRAARQRR